MKLLSIPKEAAACRAAFAAQPGATAALHVHHEIFAEPIIEPIEHRIAFILTVKPKHERALRLRLMRPLPPAYDDAVIVDAAAAATDAYDAAAEAAYAARVAAFAAAYDAEDAAYAAARAAADAARDDAYEAVIGDAQAVIVAAQKQHDARCVPDCPWNSKTIFSEIV